MGGLEDHRGFGALHPQFWGLEPPLVVNCNLQHFDSAHTGFLLSYGYSVYYSSAMGLSTHLGRGRKLQFSDSKISTKK